MKLLLIGEFGQVVHLPELLSAQGFVCDSAATFDAGRSALDEPAAIVCADAAFLNFTRPGPQGFLAPLIVLLDDPVAISVVVDRMKRGASNCLGRGELAGLPALLREEIESYENRRSGPALETVVAAERLRLLGRLAAGAVHEVNNALTAILNFAAVLARDLPEGREREMVASIRTESRRIAELAGSVQGLAKSGGAARAIRTVPFLREFERVAARFMKRDRIALELTPGEDLPDLFGVPEELEMVLYLLVCQIAANVRRESASGGWHTIRFSVDAWCSGAAVRIVLDTVMPDGFEPDSGVDVVVRVLIKKNGGGYTRESGTGAERFLLFFKSASASPANA